MNKRTIKRQKQIQEENKKEWASSIGLCQKPKPQHPHHVKVSPREIPLCRIDVTGNSPYTMNKTVRPEAAHNKQKRKKHSG